MDVLILTKWASLFSILGFSFLFYSYSKQFKNPDQTSHFELYDLGLHCLPMPHKQDVRLIRVKLKINSHNNYAPKSEKFKRFLKSFGQINSLYMYIKFRSRIYLESAWHGINVRYTELKKKCNTKFSFEIPEQPFA